MDFNAEISDGLDEIAKEASVPLEYWRAESEQWMRLCGYIGDTPTEIVAANAILLTTESRIVFVRNWQEQLVENGESFKPMEGDRIRDGGLLLEVMQLATATSFGGTSKTATYDFVGPDRRTMQINTKVLEGTVR